MALLQICSSRIKGSTLLTQLLLQKGWCELTRSSEAIRWEVSTTALQGAPSHEVKLQNSLLLEVVISNKIIIIFFLSLVVVNIMIHIQLPSLEVQKPLTARRRDAACNMFVSSYPLVSISGHGMR